MRNFLPARVTPCRPEVEENYFAPVGEEIERLSRQFWKREFRSKGMLGDSCNTVTSTMLVQVIECHHHSDRRDADQNLLSQCVVLDRSSDASSTLPWQRDSPYPPSSRRNYRRYRAPSRW